jgi:hypothetical protein
MKKLGINPNFSPYPRSGSLQFGYGGATRLRPSPSLLTQNTRASMLLTAKTDTDSFDTTDTLFPALH